LRIDGPRGFFHFDDTRNEHFREWNGLVRRSDAGVISQQFPAAALGRSGGLHERRKRQERGLSTNNRQSGPP
jgi:hypothetical protein